MAHRSPARWLAPLVLVGAALTVVWVVSSSTGGGGSPSGSATTTRERQDAAGANGKTTSTNARRKTPRTYTVQEGDILSTVAEKTGVSVERIQELNPDVDSNALTIGQRLRLSAASR